MAILASTMRKVRGTPPHYSFLSHSSLARRRMPRFATTLYISPVSFVVCPLNVEPAMTACSSERTTRNRVSHNVEHGRRMLVGGFRFM